MVRREHAQRSLFEMLLPDAHKLWEPELRRMDEVLEDEGIVDSVFQALACRWPHSKRQGRPGTPAVVVLRMLVLKHLYDWSFDECERQVRGSLVYREFCGIGCERVPDAKTLIRIAQALGPGVLKSVVERLVRIAHRRKVIRGFRMRVDTTVVETNVHYPTDSSLLGDGVRVLTRVMKRVRERMRGLQRLRDRTRSVARKVFEIAQYSRQAGRQQVQRRMRRQYQQLMGITRKVLRDAEAVREQIARRKTGKRDAVVRSLDEKLDRVGGLVRRVLAQTRARILKGDTRHPDKLLSIFEPHTEAIRKGKVVKPTEFGKLVKIQEAESQLITDYEVCERRVPDQRLWVPALRKHQALLGRPPRLAVADAGFTSAANERVAQEMGVKRVVLPRRGRLSAARRKYQRQRWFRQALRWRSGSEGRISSLKRRHGLTRCRYRGSAGMERWVGLGVIANNLLVLGRALP
ncbi:MAG: ISNCY family transposase [Terriglobia bacterium]